MYSSYHMEEKSFSEVSWNNNIHTRETGKIFLQFVIFDVCDVSFQREQRKCVIYLASITHHWILKNGKLNEYSVWEVNPFF